MASAAQRLIAGDLVAFPTETVYGLGADASNSAAVARIYSVKGRPNDHPLIVHIASMDRMGDWASEVPEYAIALARNFWPGPMTLVLKRSELAGDFVTGGQDTVGVRVPDHVVALALLEAFEKAGGKGVAAPSANRFGHVSPTTAAAVVEELADYLSKEKAIGWFQGRMEFGPRALGGRSILGDPRSEKMQKTLNLKVKYRESFRPFAPSILQEDLSNWFDINVESPYMLLVANVKHDKQIEMTKEQKTLFGIDKLNIKRSDIPAVTHVDYSARIQTVKRDTNKRYYDLILKFIVFFSVARLRVKTHRESPRKQTT